MVVLADEHDGQLPERRHVERLEQLPLVGGAVAVEVERDGGLLPVPLREREAASERHLRAHDAMAAIEVGVLLVQVHRPAFPPGAPAAAAHELGEEGGEVAAAGEVGAVVAVGRDDGVGAGGGRLHAHRDGLLAVVEVAEAADQLRLVQRVRRDLRAAHGGHVAEEGGELARRGGHLARGRVHDVGLVGDRGLDGERLRRIGDTPDARGQGQRRRRAPGRRRDAAQAAEEDDGRGHGADRLGTRRFGLGAWTLDAAAAARGARRGGADDGVVASRCRAAERAAWRGVGLGFAFASVTRLALPLKKASMAHRWLLVGGWGGSGESQREVGAHGPGGTWRRPVRRQRAVALRVSVSGREFDRTPVELSAATRSAACRREQFGELSGPNTTMGRNWLSK